MTSSDGIDYVELAERLNIDSHKLAGVLDSIESEPMKGHIDMLSKLAGYP